MCLYLKIKREKEASPIALVKSVTKMPMGIGSSESSCPYDAKKAEPSDLLREEFLPFVSEGFVSLNENSTPRPIQILRETVVTWIRITALVGLKSHYPFHVSTLVGS